jgi:hypothetical protein
MNLVDELRNAASYLKYCTTPIDSTAVRRICLKAAAALEAANRRNHQVAAKKRTGQMPPPIRRLPGTGKAK